MGRPEWDVLLDEVNVQIARPEPPDMVADGRTRGRTDDNDKMVEPGTERVGGGEVNQSLTGESHRRKRLAPSVSRRQTGSQHDDDQGALCRSDRVRISRTPAVSRPT